MPYIKKLILHGFKSFAKKTEIIFGPNLNCIVGPNGSGKSNISDAICFVLGRLSTKSIRASKSANLIFNGGKNYKPMNEASVEMIIDNKDRKLPIDKDEISILRLVKRNGSSTYKINEEIKTRQEIIDLLASIGLDPYGFNIILQGDILRFIEMHSEQRRKIIEEIAGISIYEQRKEKSLHELEKTEEKLKEIRAVLNERSIFLRNLENERADALRYKKLEELIRVEKASLLARKIKEKESEKEKIEKELIEKNEKLNKVKINLIELNELSKKLNQRIEEINQYIEKSTGLEQEKLHNEIVELKSLIATLSLKKETSENQLREIEKRAIELKKSLLDYEQELENLKKEKPEESKKMKMYEEKKKMFSEIEDNYQKLSLIKTEFASNKAVIKEKKENIKRLMRELEILSLKLEEIYKKIEKIDKKEIEERIEKVKENIKKLNEEILNIERRNASYENEIQKLSKIEENIEKLEICPLCRSRIDDEHRKKIIPEIKKELREIDLKIKAETITKQEKETLLTEAKKELENLQQNLKKSEINEMFSREYNEKQEEYKKKNEEKIKLEKEVEELEKKQNDLSKKLISFDKLEEDYFNLKNNLELFSIGKENADVKISMLQRDIEGIKIKIKRDEKDKQDLIILIKEIKEEFEERKAILIKKEEQERILYDSFKKMFNERNELHEKIRQNDIEIMKLRESIRILEFESNELKIMKAKVDTEIESLKIELNQFGDIKIISLPVQELEGRIFRHEAELGQIGNVNLRALEVYEKVKKEYDSIAEKAEKIKAEKESILKIIETIDKKKLRTFMRTFREINQKFSENFMRLSTKGTAFLDMENKEDVFNGGVDILVKLAKGKYFDINSLSGGEKTLVALSFIFAIQEIKPHCFYIFDEIDAALDKRNSERLAGLIKQYVNKAQYILITHNDSIIPQASNLYGISMQDSISKVLSLKV